ncbi:MAG: DUF362 domain-containing protein [Desulfobacteraceae bacterium]|nr:DUF362 domain-containing protein [Desulfobacteraceae bacterium]
MENFKFKDRDVAFKMCHDRASIDRAVADIFKLYSHLLPKGKKELIFIKPNLNNDQNALMGNSTDLRMMVSVISVLKKLGYQNIVMGDGCNVGINRKKIDVFSRLKIDKLAQQLDIRLLDLNSAPSDKIDLACDLSAKVAKICHDAALFINLPKIKTHAEAVMSICLKNLVGCMAGGLEKKKMHTSLIENIVRVNEQVKPHLHIIDGLIAMEGNGPGDGTPTNIGLIVAGQDPYLIDAFCARSTGFEITEIPCLNLALDKGYLDISVIKEINQYPVLVYLEKPPAPKLTTRVLGHNIFMGLRDKARPLFDNSYVTPMLYRFGIIQDVYNTEEAIIEDLHLLQAECNDCNLCVEYCPFQLPVTSPDFSFSIEKGCIECLYCALICPKNAIRFEGELGYLTFYLQKYSDYMAKLGDRQQKS